LPTGRKIVKPGFKTVSAPAREFIPPTLHQCLN
jgi:hypothetical protein